jgi:hypothetical protein
MPFAKVLVAEPVTAREVVVALVLVLFVVVSPVSEASVPRRFVKVPVVLKKEVVVAAVVVERVAVKNERTLFPEKVLLSARRVEEAELPAVGQVLRHVSPIKQIVVAASEVEVAPVKTAFAAKRFVEVALVLVAFVEVSPVIVPKVARRFVKVPVVLKKEVVVACVPVAFVQVSFANWFVALQVFVSARRVVEAPSPAIAPQIVCPALLTWSAAPALQGPVARKSCEVEAKVAKSVVAVALVAVRFVKVALPETARVVVVALVLVLFVVVSPVSEASVPRSVVKVPVVLKKEVVVACVPVALVKRRFGKVLLALVVAVKFAATASPTTLSFA